ncbi:hypothetical protein LTR37_021136 [Vermiconidia calcicola]|uniref:Uncharacterized protein n=1 Tax=Vermiconidia calcicola TaxID=1690605 RepID=A0ACC3MB34_9PEZI|nr:hypothetical protein LTR37_021136 [Vermiconidia calcicola]
MDNPNKILSDAIKGQNITKIIVFQVTAGSADTVKPSTVGTTVPGGGTANIDFLTGDDKKDGPNSAVPFMPATFWIETVENEITEPPFPPGRQNPIRVKPHSPNASGPSSTFLVQSPAQRVTILRHITVLSTQIQYSQTVILNFAGLSWPHVSVATLLPADNVSATIYL